jgi:hypothetical protein
MQEEVIIVTRRTTSERLVQLEAQKKAFQLRLSKQERAIDTRRKVLLGALVLHRLENSHAASSSRPFLEWLQRELPAFLVRDGDRDLFDDLLKPWRDDQSSSDMGTMA